MVKIKRIGEEMSGVLYITEKGTYLMDINFHKGTDVSKMAIYRLSMNNPDGEPMYQLKSEQFEVVDDF